MSDFIIIIPARLKSSRLPNKPLQKIAGLPLIQHTFLNARKAQAKRTIIAVDDEKVFEICKNFTDDVVLTSDKHNSGTDRLSEVVEKLQLDKNEIIVNVQGDEPQLSSSLIKQVANLLQDKTNASIATLYTKINSINELFDNSIVKVVKDNNDYAMFFSRSVIPFARDEFKVSKEILPANIDFYRHLGLYAYRVSFLQDFSKLAEAKIEQIEKLEQLRAMFYGYKIALAEACESAAIGIDTEEDLLRFRSLFTKDKQFQNLV